MMMEKDVVAVALASVGGTVAFWSFVLAYQLNGIKNAIREHNRLRKEWEYLEKKKGGNDK